MSNRSTKLTTLEILEKMLTALAIYNEIVQAVMLKSMVLDLEWFDGDRTKFEDWWKRICLFLKSNKVIALDDKITTVLAQLRGSLVGIYVQKKIDQMEDKEDT